ncbi:MAG: DUF2399 domain-containing protein [Fusobacterium sp.]|uniref:DUF2399 domain-containing protein n=1 Tax=Fusobacterium sp. TaxID=68766 RepID=UPI0015A60FFF|nr:DUF2399 domain-containing protein [uncultured Fusobacterium sp.]
MTNIEKCANLFKKDKRNDVIFEKFKKKILTTDKIEGSILIKNPSKEIRRLIEGFFYFKNFKGETLSFSIEDFRKRLEELGYIDIDLKELTNQYFGEVLLSKEEQKKLLNEEIELFFSKLVSKLKESNLQEEYITKYIEIVKNNYFDKGKLKEQEEELQKLYYCGMAIYDRTTADTPIKIAFLGEKITKDPHYFDKGIKGSLLVKLLKLFNNIEVDEDLTETEKAQEIFYQSKIEVNTISNYLTAYGIKLFTKAGEIKAYSEFIKDNLLYNIPLEHLKDVVKVQAKSKNIFIVENEMVFVRLYEYFRGKKDVALICTSGQLRLASLVLIDLLLKEDYQIYYSGDIDPEGIGILNRVIQKSGNKVIPWRVNLETYLKYEKNENPISETSLKKLTSIKDTRFKDLILAMEDIKKACYQESFIKELINDIKFF